MMPITELLKKSEDKNSHTKIIFDEKCKNVFHIIIQKLTEAPVLSYPDFDEKFILTTDASKYCIGGVLSHTKWN